MFTFRFYVSFKSREKEKTMSATEIKCGDCADQQDQAQKTNYPISQIENKDLVEVAKALYAMDRKGSPKVQPRYAELVMSIKPEHRILVAKVLEAKDVEVNNSLSNRLARLVCKYWWMLMATTLAVSIGWRVYTIIRNKDDDLEVVDDAEEGADIQKLVA